MAHRICVIIVISFAGQSQMRGGFRTIRCEYQDPRAGLSERKALLAVRLDKALGGDEVPFAS
jgi:hypothetical protein